MPICTFPSLSPNIRCDRRFWYHLHRPYLVWLVFLFTAGCTPLISSTAVDFAGSLSHAIRNHNDLATVEAAGPAYLLMIDGMLHADPHNDAMLLAASRLYTAYTNIYVDDPQRAQKLTEKALAYAQQAACIRSDHLCALRELPFDDFADRIQHSDIRHIDWMYTLGAAWSAWINTRSDDWHAAAEIARVELIMQRVIELDETHQDGSAHVYMGVLATLLPKALGGHPETGRRHFERAIEISRGRDLMAKVLFAKRYARLVFDRKLHDRLLREVLAAPANVPGYTLLNTLAQKQARQLLADADDYF